VGGIAGLGEQKSGQIKLFARFRLFAAISLPRKSAGT
jgi:hypothetical protein